MRTLDAIGFTRDDGGSIAQDFVVFRYLLHSQTAYRPSGMEI
jgi:hypothetical protein